ncbi:hypothetical protein [Actinobacillus equuli]|uniref:hypothetical protein n=1 Tax=Actinobacillus equuli TaxID=718 RepID=UPI002441404B|nr:hypothetical protein [Actinobacillus equuli]WGE52404.1 hypothetical protein NYR69_08115 [Actinobacillus equuli subsp. haemolyticus]
MKNSDFIQMTQCAMYSIKFPHDKFVETIETASYPDRGDGFSVEVVTNPLTGNKVQLLGEGYFFTLRVNYRKITKEMLTAKVAEMKQKIDLALANHWTIKEWTMYARDELLGTIPTSSEEMNVFYSPEKELLIVNKNSKTAKLHSVC